MSKVKEKFESKKERKDYLFAANHVFNKVLRDFDEKVSKYDEQKILDVEVNSLTFNDMFILLYSFRALVGKEVDKIVTDYCSDEIKK